MSRSGKLSCNRTALKRCAKTEHIIIIIIMIVVVITVIIIIIITIHLRIR